MYARSFLRFRLWAFLAIFLAVSLVIVLADYGSLPPFVYALYAFPQGDKVGHFALMGLLALGLNLLFPNQLNRRSSPRLFTGSKIAMLLVTVEEISQIIFISRSFSIIDLGFSYMGILSVEILIRWSKHLQGKRQNSWSS